MRVLFPALLTMALVAPGARASVPAGPGDPPADVTGSALSTPAPAPVKEAAALAWTLPAPSGPPHLSRPRRGPKPDPEGLQLQAKPHVWPIRLARFLGWAFVP